MEPPTLFDQRLGEKASDVGADRAANATRAWPWREHALAAIRELAASGQPFTSDEVIAVVGLPDVGQNKNNSVGAMFRIARDRGWIVHTGVYRKSRRVLSRARAIAVWAGNPDHDF